MGAKEEEEMEKCPREEREEAIPTHCMVRPS
jgi:hypothetical protein